jgi:hypothetical protein
MSTQAVSFTNSPSQLMRDIFLYFFISVAAVLYHHLLQIYLRGLDKPLVLELGFLSSLAIACAYHFKGAKWRYALVACLATAVVFDFGAWMAQFFRREYIEFLDQFKNDGTFVEFIGRDLHAALTARYVGYGGCFALGLLLARITIGRLINGPLNSFFISPENRAKSCPCCGQLTK